MKYEIKNRLTDAIIFECEAESMREAVEKAVKAKVSLSGANLRYANLCGANLCGANLSGADLSGADLRYANLSGANLRGAELCGADLRGAELCGANLRYANLHDADLRGAELCGANLRYANLRGANLRGAELCGADLRGAELCGADLRGAELCGANLRGAELCGVPEIENIHQAVYAAASQPGALNMGIWHTCETTHCRAGWVTTLAGEAGAKLESEMGPSGAAALIYYASDPELERVPDFYASNEDALADMKRLAEQEARGQ